MANIENNTENTPASWSLYKKIAFRIAFVFFILVSIPLSSGWYQSLFAIDWTRPHYRDIYSIARFGTSVPNWFFGSDRGGFGDGESQEGGAGQGEGAGQGRNRGNGQGEGFGRRDSTNTDRRGNGRPDSLKRGTDRTERNTGGGSREGFKKRGNKDSSAAAIARVGGAGRGDRNRGSGEGRRAGFSRRQNRDSTVNGQAAYANADTSRRGNGENFRRRFRRTEGGDSIRRDSAGGRRDRRKDFYANAGGGERRNRNKERDTLKQTDNKTDTLKNAGFGAARRNGNNGNAAETVRSRNWLSDYTSWGNALAIAVIAGLVWTLIDRKRPSYNVLYYWLTVIVRYRAAIGIIGFGYTKLFPTQMPYPSLGLLNTDFGDFTAQKIYWLSVGIVPWYQVFGGIVEIAAGALLMFRKTATYGAILLIGALGDITFVNYAYDGGVHVYAFYFVLLGSFVIAADVPRLYNLLIRERYTVPHFYYPDFTKPVFKYTRIGLKGLTILIFFVILTYTEVVNFKYDPYKQPSTAGVKTLRGNYNVTEFKINGQLIPYSPLDSVRWKEATFEKWTTLTFKVNKPVAIDPSNGGGSPMRDIQRTFEITGTAGGQRAFHYYADTVEQVLYLQDKNAVASRGGARGGRGAGGQTGRADLGNSRENKPAESWISAAAWKNIGDENKMIDSRAWSARRDREFARPERSSNRNKMVLKYSTKDGSRVILTGINESKDSIYVVLDKIDRKYVLSGSTLNAGKY